MAYSPSYVNGFGLSDGEGNERLWSSLSNTIGKERSMTLAHRHMCLESRMHRIGHDKVKVIAGLLFKRMERVNVKRDEATLTLSEHGKLLEAFMRSASWENVLQFKDEHVPAAL